MSSVFIHSATANPAVTVAVFGGTGFIGRALVQAMARAGYRVRVATRDMFKAAPLRSFGAVGQVVPVACRTASADSVKAAIGDATVVVNLLGILYEKGGARFESIHVETAARIAEAAKAAGAARLLHVSAMGADAESDSAYAASKARGEAAVLAAFPDATVIRPSVVFGPGDGLFTRFAGLARNLPVLPLFGGGATRMQPVYIGDVITAMMAMLATDSAKGRIYELAGPRAVTLRELFEITLAQTGHARPLVPVPFAFASIQAAVLGLLPKPPLTLDQVRLLKVDNVPGGVLPGLADLGIEPTPMEAVLPQYLDRFRIGGRFAKKKTRAEELA